VTDDNKVGVCIVISQRADEVDPAAAKNNPTVEEIKNQLLAKAK
jgi:hypothetical protein